MLDVRQKSVRFMRSKSLSSVASVGARELESTSPASGRAGVPCSHRPPVFVNEQTGNSDLIVCSQVSSLTVSQLTAWLLRRYHVGDVSARKSVHACSCKCRRSGLPVTGFPVAAIPYVALSGIGRCRKIH